MKHEGYTPGPWFACCVEVDEPDSQCHCGYIFESAGGDKTIAQVLHNDPAMPRYEKMGGTVPVAEKNANAKLIADAPAIYEDNQRLREKGHSLVDILDVVDKAIGGAFAFMAIHSMPYTGPNYSKELEVLRAALASTEPGVCRWRRRAKKTTGAIHWIGDCGLVCASVAEGPEASDMHYCPKCGKPLEVVEPSEEDSDG